LNDILDFSKIEAGMLELEEHPFIVKNSVQSVCNLLNGQARDKAINLSYQVSEEMPHTLIGDSSRLRQILLNLISNAIKFTQQGNIAIAVSSRELQHQNPSTYELTFAVADTGIGIDRDRLIKLFQPFSQADSSISRKYGGTGLGLAICKRLVELMGGTIWVESNGNIGGTPPVDWELRHSDRHTQGSTFYFTILMKTSEEPVVIASPYQNAKLAIANAHPSALKILVAEDNQVNQKLAIFMLKKLGCHADIAGNGIAVLDMLKQKLYDVILMDMQMPEMDGITTTQIIRIQSKHQPWIIAMTAHAIGDARESCLDAGMNDYISKPIRLEELTQALIKISKLSPIT